MWPDGEPEADELPIILGVTVVIIVLAALVLAAMAMVY